MLPDDISPPPRLPRTTPRLVRWIDSFVRRTITLFGVGVIAVVLGMFIFILVEVWPLLQSPAATTGPTLHPTPETSLYAGVDPFGDSVWTLSADGIVRMVDVPPGSSPGEADVQRGQPRPDRTLKLEDWRVDGEVPAPVELVPALSPTPSPPASPPPVVVTCATRQGDWLVAGSGDGRVWVGKLSFEPSFEGDIRHTDGHLERVAVLRLDERGTPLKSVTFAATDEHERVFALTADGRLVGALSNLEENLLEGLTRTWAPISLADSPTMGISLSLDALGRHLAVATGGELWLWDVASATKGPQHLKLAGEPTTLVWLLGGESLVVGRSDGAITTWMRVGREEEGLSFQEVTTLTPQAAPISQLVAGARSRSFLSVAGGDLVLHHRTSGRSWPLSIPPGVVGAWFGPREDQLLTQTSEGKLLLSDLENAHPEVSATTLFRPVWYEGYAKPESVWQSTGGSDEFEPKLSLLPLVWGTLKGTFYALIFAAPLGILAAIYTSLFLDGTTRRWVKPTIEIMASLPSVVLGFLAALWLAPRMAGHLPSILAALLLIPIASVLAGFLWHRLSRQKRAALPGFAPVVWLALMLGIAVTLSAPLGRTVESLFFEGDFRQWMAESGTVVDRRNSLVVAFALGFAVIPLIYTISEDAISAVPPSLKSASLACGASLWQTAVRVMVPAAAPGILSAIMIGFGRAVGETMIVLMATGNTPIMDISLFNGFRTLSANIAVELPEAPVDSSLYRLLFLSALLLFGLTFVINSAAEVVRARLRSRFKAM